jgi:hypothetical protein
MVERRMERRERQRERERAILGARPPMSFSNRMKRSRRQRIVGQSLVDCTLYRKWVRAGGWIILFFCFEESLVLCLFLKVGFEFIVGWIHQHPQVCKAS